MLLTTASLAQAGNPDVTTYHNDRQRTGWNQEESLLTPTAVAGTSFQKLATVALDEQVDAQPLYVARQPIAGKGIHNTVYVATENNSVYAIDAETGNILIRRNFGLPVPLSAIPGGCPNNIRSVGINSTPVIDKASGTLYVLTYNYGSGKPTYYFHALDLSTLKDKVPRKLATGSATLTDGTTFPFSSETNRQRVALLLSHKTVYAAFTSFCDNIPSKTRGWILGFQTGTASPHSGMIANKLATSPQSYFLSTIWMSGYGLATDSYENIYFVTGNSDPLNTQYYPNNLAESVVKLTPDLGHVASFFTPGTAATGRQALDQNDLDFGAGGAMVIPDQPGKYPRLVVAAGKVGTMYLMNQLSLGRYTNGADNVLQTVNIGECYCGPSYFKGADGVGRVVSSGGQQVKVWKIVTSSDAAPQLVKESESPPITSGQDSGFFTSVTSNGTRAGSQVIWALSRPNRTNPQGIQLYAFDPNAGGGLAKTIFIGNAGVWPDSDGNANLVPMVTNGHVYVASYKQLTIFGLAKAWATATTVAEPQVATAAEETAPALPGHVVYGKLIGVQGATLTLETRTGKHLTVDPAAAKKAETAALPVVGRAYQARGEYDQQGVLHAVSVQRVKDQPELWKADR
jgi:outer membrane protein assembly factor BamB